MRPTLSSGQLLFERARETGQEGRYLAYWVVLYGIRTGEARVLDRSVLSCGDARGQQPKVTPPQRQLSYAARKQRRVANLRRPQCVEEVTGAERGDTTGGRR